MKVRVIASLVLALCLAVGSASASSIGVFFAPDGSDCDATIGGFSSGTFHILGILGGDAAAGGVTGVEFRLVGVPGGWFLTPTVNPVFNTVVGTSLAIGYNLASASCQAGSGGVLNLFSISYFATTAEPPSYWGIDRHTNPSNPQFPCPLMVLCDPPVYTKLCVGGGEARVNGGPCTVGVEETSWSTLKSLYN